MKPLKDLLTNTIKFKCTSVVRVVNYEARKPYNDFGRESIRFETDCDMIIVDFIHNNFKKNNV